MNPLAILKLFKDAKDLHDYVKKPNNLDNQNEMILSRLNKVEQKIETLEIENAALRNVMKTLEIKLR